MNLALPVVAGATLVGAVVIAWGLFGRRAKGSRDADPPRIDLPRVGRTALVMLAVGAVELLIVVGVLHRQFLAVNLVYTQLMVLVPLAGIAVLIADRVSRRSGVRVSAPRVSPGARRLAAASLLLVPVGFVATFVEPYRLVTETATIELAPPRALPRALVIGVLSDIQCVEVTDRERDAVARVMATRPDLVLLPGDLQQLGFEHRDEIAPQLRELLAPLDAPLGVYYVEGDTEDCAQARYLLAGTRVRVLKDEIVRVEHAGARLTLAGVTLGARSAAARAVLSELERAPDQDDLRIVIAHRPDVVLTLDRKTRVDLVVAGHTHGGQVALPFLGPPITLSDVPRRVAAGGFHDLDGRRIYVSRGIGWEHGHAPRVRFLCAPEVSVLTVR